MKKSKNTQKSVETFAELVQILDEEERTNYTEILNALELPIVEFKKYATWSESCYTRNCIVENENFELLLICWDKKQVTEIHDHGGEECWMYFVEGVFRENIYQKNEIEELKVVKTTEFTSGGVSYMKDFMGFHDLENVSNQKSISLHLYAKPIRKCNVYDTNKGQFVSKELSYDKKHELLK